MNKEHRSFHKLTFNIKLDMNPNFNMIVYLNNYYRAFKSYDIKSLSRPPDVNVVFETLQLECSILCIK